MGRNSKNKKVLKNKNKNRRRRRRRKKEDKMKRGTTKKKINVERKVFIILFQLKGVERNPNKLK